jgi:SAM-dependent methyltransferase
MLSQARQDIVGLPVVAADAVHLPIVSQSVDASLSAFLVSHLPEPYLLLAEAARVTRRGGLVMAMTFAAGDDHPAKHAVDEVARRMGWHAPGWLDEQKRWAALTDTPAGLVHQAEKAGIPASEVRAFAVDAGRLTPGELVAWRLGHAHMAGYVTQLDLGDRNRLVSEVERAVGPGPQRLRRELLVLSSHLPA